MRCPLPPETTPMTTPAVRIVVSVELELASTRPGPPAFDFLHIATNASIEAISSQIFPLIVGIVATVNFKVAPCSCLNSELGLTDKYCETGVRLLAFSLHSCRNDFETGPGNIGPRNASKDLEPTRSCGPRAQRVGSRFH